MERTGILAHLRPNGFDLSFVTPFEKGATVRCSQCEASAICGVACHESGCPNQTFECRGCYAQVPRRGMFCAECK